MRDADLLAATEFAVIAHLEEAINDAARSDLDEMLSGGTARLGRLLARLIHRRPERNGDPFAAVQPHELEHVLLGCLQTGRSPGSARAEQGPPAPLRLVIRSLAASPSLVPIIHIEFPDPVLEVEARRLGAEFLSRPVETSVLLKGYRAAPRNEPQALRVPAKAGVWSPQGPRR